MCYNTLVLGGTSTTVPRSRQLARQFPRRPSSPRGASLPLTFPQLLLSQLLAHSFALAQSPTPSFSFLCALFGKNTRGGIPPNRASDEDASPERASRSEGPLRFLFNCLHTLSFCVWDKSFVCHSYENCRGVPTFFPKWNSPLAPLAPFIHGAPATPHAPETTTQFFPARGGFLGCRRASSRNPARHSWRR